MIEPVGEGVAFAGVIGVGAGEDGGAPPPSLGAREAVEVGAIICDNYEAVGCCKLRG